MSETTETTEDSGARGLRGFKFSPLQIHCPIKRIKIKKLHYRIVLVMGGAGFYVCHVCFHEYLIMGVPIDIHWAVAVNTMFALDPTA